MFQNTLYSLILTLVTCAAVPVFACEESLKKPEDPVKLGATAAALFVKAEQEVAITVQLRGNLARVRDTRLATELRQMVTRLAAVPGDHLVHLPSVDAQSHYDRTMALRQGKI